MQNNNKNNTFESKTFEELKTQKLKNKKIISVFGVLRSIVPFLILLLGNITTVSSSFGSDKVYKYVDYLNNETDKITYLLFMGLLAIGLIITIVAAKNSNSPAVKKLDIAASLILLAYGAWFFYMGIAFASSQTSYYSTASMTSLVWLCLTAAIIFAHLMCYLGISQIEKAEKAKRAKGDIK